MFDKILIANDGSDGARRALDAAIDLAVSFGSELHMISIEEALPQYARTLDDVNEEKEIEDSYFGQLGTQCQRLAALKGVKLEHTILAGHAVQTIIEFARARAFQLLVVGFHGHSAIYEHLWGGSSQNLTRMAPCSVLVVK
jgi:nucleotide-binding universal stress UspA family protein